VPAGNEENQIESPKKANTENIPNSIETRRQIDAGYKDGGGADFPVEGGTTGGRPGRAIRKGSKRQREGGTETII